MEFDTKNLKPDGLLVGGMSGGITVFKSFVNDVKKNVNINQTHIKDKDIKKVFSIVGINSAS